MDNVDLSAFSFLDPKVLGWLVALLLMWIQYTKMYIPDKWIRVYSLVCAVFFGMLLDSCNSGTCTSFIPQSVAKLILYGVIAASGSGLGYKVLTPKNGVSVDKQKNDPIIVKGNFPGGKAPDGH